METQNFKLIASESIIEWVGRKVTGSHNGTIDLKEGTLEFNNGTLKSGKVVIDTTSIKILDIADKATNEQFAGHLASDDFFNSNQFPEAVLEIDSVTSSNNISHITGDLTIKGITHPIAFDTAIASNNSEITFTGKIVIDRTKYGIKFRSGNFFKDLGDTMIYNNFDLNINVTARIA